MSTDFFDDDLRQRRGAIRSSSVGQGTDIVGPRPDELPARPVSDLNLARMARRREETGASVAGVKQELDRLQRRQTDLEREKQALEEMLQKQDEYDRGRKEMVDRINESLVTLEKLEDRSARLTEIYSGTRHRFAQMLQELEGINDASWTDENFREELNKAVVLIDTVRKEFVKALAAVEAAGGAPLPVEPPYRQPAGARETAAATPTGFGTWLKIGLAFSLPAIVVIILVAAIWLALTSKGV